MGALFIPKQIPRSSLLDDANLVLRVLKENPGLGQSSRLTMIARAVVAGGDAVIPATREDFSLVQQANKDLLEFSFIWHELEPSPAKKELWRRFGKLFGDDPLPSKSTEKSDARRIQFELLCEAMLARAGLSPRHNPNGADFECHLNGENFVVEAKTARSVPAVRRELCRGAKQVHKSALPGFLVLDYTFAVNDSSQDHILAYGKPIADPATAQRRRFAYFRNHELRRVEEKLIEKGVIGLVLVDRLVIQNGFDPVSRAGKWELAWFRDHLCLPCQVERHNQLSQSVLSLLGDYGLPIPPEP